MEEKKLIMDTKDVLGFIKSCIKDRILTGANIDETTKEKYVELLKSIIHTAHRSLVNNTDKISPEHLRIIMDIVNESVILLDYYSTKIIKGK